MRQDRMRPILPLFAISICVMLSTVAVAADNASQSDVVPPQPDGPQLAGPFYPAKARQLNEQGVVTVLFTIAENGTVNDPVVVQSSGFADLDAAGLEAARTWRYRPATKNGKPFAARMQTRIKFELTAANSAPPDSASANLPYDEVKMSIADYPQDAVDAKQEGRVAVLVIIGEEGNVASATIARSSGFQSLDQASLAMANSRWHFTAAMRDGNPMKSASYLIFNWRLPSRPTLER